MRRRERGIEHDGQAVRIIVVGGDAVDRDFILAARCRGSRASTSPAASARTGCRWRRDTAGRSRPCPCACRTGRSTSSVDWKPLGTPASASSAFDALRIIVPAARQLLVPPGRALDDRHAFKRLAAAEEGDLDDVVALHRMRDGAAHARIGERALRSVEEDVHERAFDRIELEPRIVLDRAPSTARAHIRSCRRRRTAARRSAGSRRRRRRT